MTYGMAVTRQLRYHVNEAQKDMLGMHSLLTYMVQLSERHCL